MLKTISTTKRLARWAGAGCAVGCLCGPQALAQDALRNAVQSDREFESRNAARTQIQDRPISAGPVLFRASVGYALEWNDNIRYTTARSESDFISRPQMHVTGFWPATDQTMLSFGVGVSYEHYLDNSHLSHLNVSPDSALAWDITAKDWLFTIYDRISYSQEVISQAALSGTARFPRFENTAGLRARWQPSHYEFQMGYSHYNFYATKSEYDYLTRSSEQFFGRAAWRFAEKTQAGIEASGSLTHYDSSDRSDNQSLSFGPFVEWQVLEALRLSARGGYVTYFMNKAVYGGSDTLSSYYMGFDAQHRLTDYLTHGLSVTRDVQQSVLQGSSFTEHFRVGYTTSWAFHHSASLSLNGFFEQGDETRAGFSEKYDRFGFGCSVRWQLLKDLSASLAYRFTNRNSNSKQRANNYDYDQNVVTLSAIYQF